MKKASVLLFSILAASCGTSTSALNDAPPVTPRECNVRIFTSQEDAEKEGVIEELCTINETTSGSLSSAIITMIEKNKHRVCDCGATNVYIEFQETTTSGRTKVRLVGFRFVMEEPED